MAVIAPVMLGLAISGLSVASCGGGASPSSVANLGGKTSTTAPGADAAGTTPINPAVAAKHYEQALKFSQCMRAHGVGDFPDPTSGGGIQISDSGPGGDLGPGNPKFASAQQACRKYFPARAPSPQQEAQAQARALAFAACMRKNGVPRFPDPQFFSGGRIAEKITGGVDPNSPAFQAAQQKCNS